MRKACAEAGCLNYSTNGAPRCPAHQRPLDAANDQRKARARAIRKSTGDGAQARLRSALRNVGAGRCARCGFVYAPAFLEADHITPLVDGGLDIDANVQPLCTPCHRHKTSAEARARSARRSSGGGHGGRGA